MIYCRWVSQTRFATFENKRSNATNENFCLIDVIEQLMFIALFFVPKYILADSSCLARIRIPFVAPEKSGGTLLFLVL